MANGIIDACEQHHNNMVLVDVRELKGRLNIFDSLSLITGEFPKLRQRGVLKRAVIADLKERRERYRFFEIAARYRGFNLTAFEEVDNAIEWLTDMVIEAST